MKAEQSSRSTRSPVIDEVRTYLWLEELAAQTGIPTNTLRSWRSQGTGGPRSFTIGRRVAYDLADVRSWLEGERDHSGR